MQVLNFMMKMNQHRRYLARRGGVKQEHHLRLLVLCKVVLDKWTKWANIQYSIFRSRIWMLQDSEGVQVVIVVCIFCLKLPSGIKEKGNREADRLSSIRVYGLSRETDREGVAR